jgi:ABC-type spermidine/putrescine transport system permease subunit II
MRSPHHHSAAGAALGIFGILFVLPLIYFFVISFWTRGPVQAQPDFTFVNYGQVYDQHTSTLASP